MNAKDITAKLDSLSGLIKRASELCEIAEIPLSEVYGSVEVFCDATSKKTLELIPINLEDYERDTADWKIAWKEHRDVLIEYCKEMLGDAAKKKKKEGLPAYSKRLLFECHLNQLGNKWKERIPAKGSIPTKFIEDQAAHELLRRWGGMSKEAFNAEYKQTDHDLIERAAKALGVKAASKAKTFPIMVHKAAVRFANNTTLF